MAKAQVKPWVKTAGKVLGTIAVLVVLYFLALQSGVVGKSDGKSGIFGGSSDDNTIVVGTNTFVGFLPYMYLNGGLDPNEDCILYRDYGIKMKVVVQDDFPAGRKAFMNGDIDLIYGTLDSYPVEMGEGSDMADTRFFNVSNFSVGADAIVVNKRINTVNDLIGKVVCCSKGTASHTLLLNTLETSGITLDQINESETVMPDKINIKVVENGLDASAAYRAGACDAAVVYSPDDQDIVENMAGSKVLVSTKQASSIICDGLIAKESTLKEKRDIIKKLMAALLWANTEMNNNPEAVKVAAKTFSQNYDFTYDLCMQCVKGVRYMTLEDELNFFGMNTDFTGMTASELYSKMARTYSKLGLVSSPLSWNKVSDTSIIEELKAEGKVKGEQSAAKAKTFTAPTAEMETAQEMSVKKLSIEYPTGSAVIDNNAKSLIDREFVSIAKQFAGSRIRIEGNTDDTGSDAVNIPLSKQRAQAAANYLINEYGFDKNRFIIVGNGSKKAKAAGATGANAAYRTTDFELVNE